MTMSICLFTGERNIKTDLDLLGKGEHRQEQKHLGMVSVDNVQRQMVHVRNLLEKTKKIQNTIYLGKSPFSKSTPNATDTSSKDVSSPVQHQSSVTNVVKNLFRGAKKEITKTGK